MTFFFDNRSSALIPLAGLILVLIFLAGCADENKTVDDDVLIRVNGLTVTGEAFSDALEIAKASYPFSALQDEAIVHTIKKRLLKQMTEELVLAGRAEELGITVSDAEVDEVLASVREDYPEELFEAALLESAIPMQAWKERLRMRLLMEKLIEQELVSQVSVTPDEISRYYEQKPWDPQMRHGQAEAIDSTLVRQLRREKAQDKYPEWIEEIQQHYQVELNTEKWKEILD